MTMPSLTPHITPLVLIESTTDHAIGTCGNVSLYVWRRHTRTAAIPAVLKAFAEAQKAGGGRFANYGIVEEGAALPEAEMRARLARLMRDAGAHIVASVITFEGSGFRASAVRTAAAGLALIARQPYPHRVFSATGEAAEWMVTAMQKSKASSPSSAAVGAAIEMLRRS